MSWRQWVAVFLLFVLLGLRQIPRLPLTTQITAHNDLDGFMKLRGIESNPTLGGALRWFVGDDPQGVHTFRPLPALTLLVEYLLWGYRWFPYQVMNLIYFVLTGMVLTRFCLLLGFPFPFALGSGAMLMAQKTRGAEAVLRLAGTRHDLLCVLFSLLALLQLVNFLEKKGGGSALLLYAFWTLLAYLSKEMTLALTLLCFFIIVMERYRGVARRETWRATLVTAGVACAWMIWYHFAEQNMAEIADSSHSFAGWWHLLVKRWPRPLWFFLCSMNDSAAKVYMLTRLLSPGALIIYRFFLPALLKTWWFAFCVTVLVVWRRWWLAVVFAWKAFTYLPVLPLSETWPWHVYMPHVLDPLLSTGAAWCLWERMGLKDAVAPYLQGKKVRLWQVKCSYPRLPDG